MSSTPKCISVASPEEVRVASEASGPSSKTVHIRPFLKAILTDGVSGYVYAGSRGRACGNGVMTRPRLKHRGKLGDLFPTGTQQRLFLHLEVCVTEVLYSCGSRCRV